MPELVPGGRVGAALSLCDRLAPLSPLYRRSRERNIRVERFVAVPFTLDRFSRHDNDGLDPVEAPQRRLDGMENSVPPGVSVDFQLDRA
jgi:hypothetical protein